MKLFQTSITILLFAVLLIVLPTSVFAVPGMPHQFYGTVTFSGTAAPDGLIVEVRVDGETVGSAATLDGKYGFNPDLLFAVNDGAEWTGIEEASFVVGGITADQIMTLSRGGYNELALTLTGSVGSVSVEEGESIENETIVVTPESPTLVSVGNDIDITISSTVSTNAEITKIEKLESDFFTGVTAIIAENNLLNAFEINITGDNLIISVTITYDDTGIDEDTIKPYKFDGTSWEALDFTIDKSANTITFTVSSAETPYAVFGESPPPSPSPSPAPSGGSGPITQTTSTPTPTILSEAAQAVDTNGDGKIDVLDFNSLVVNWGSTESDNIADFDNNGTVDIFDFNLLMTYWTG